MRARILIVDATEVELTYVAMLTDGLESMPACTNRASSSPCQVSLFRQPPPLGTLMPNSPLPSLSYPRHFLCSPLLPFSES